MLYNGNIFIILLLYINKKCSALYSNKIDDFTIENLEDYVIEYEPEVSDDLKFTKIKKKVYLKYNQHTFMPNTYQENIASEFGEFGPIYRDFSNYRTGTTGKTFSKKKHEYNYQRNILDTKFLSYLSNVTGYFNFKRREQKIINIYTQLNLTCNIKTKYVNRITWHMSSSEKFNIEVPIPNIDKGIELNIQKLNISIDMYIRCKYKDAENTIYGNEHKIIYFNPRIYKEFKEIDEGFINWNTVNHTSNITQERFSSVKIDCGIDQNFMKKFSHRIMVMWFFKTRDSNKIDNDIDTYVDQFTGILYFNQLTFNNDGDYRCGIYSRRLLQLSYKSYRINVLYKKSGIIQQMKFEDIDVKNKDELISKKKKYRREGILSREFKAKINHNLFITSGQTINYERPSMTNPLIIYKRDNLTTLNIHNRLHIVCLGEGSIFNYDYNVYDKPELQWIDNNIVVRKSKWSKNTELFNNEFNKNEYTLKMNCNGMTKEIKIKKGITFNKHDVTYVNAVAKSTIKLTCLKEYSSLTSWTYNNNDLSSNNVLELNNICSMKSKCVNGGGIYSCKYKYQYLTFRKYFKLFVYEPIKAASVPEDVSLNKDSIVKLRCIFTTDINLKNELYWTFNNKKLVEVKNKIYYEINTEGNLITFILIINTTRLPLHGNEMKGDYSCIIKHDFSELSLSMQLYASSGISYIWNTIMYIFIGTSLVITVFLVYRCSQNKPTPRYIKDLEQNSKDEKSYS